VHIGGQQRADLIALVQRRAWDGAMAGVQGDAVNGRAGARPAIAIVSAAGALA
jgi:hypothetical protein